ncbi:hypothetical protein ACFQZ4_24050 [Catellatospora coxensis]|uniref:Uncharacterized protein n=1 Tax=Catellatospora coxensis TaxID=310354 RepID=A0A8J3L0D9_9ACTN|nr:hypothetical protein [Catellatospora coxensis]GIG10190.1 hypothetical protein Cco03nite_68900 [Catellatospora coxensis]
MPEQPRFDPTAQGIYRDLLVTGDGVAHLHFRAWDIAIAEGLPVGTCAKCGAELTGQYGRRHGRITWYEATCSGRRGEGGSTVPGCGHEYAMPNGQVLRGSSRHDHMPAGWWEKRTEALKAASDQ